MHLLRIVKIMPYPHSPIYLYFPDRGSGAEAVRQKKCPPCQGRRSGHFF